MREIEIIKTLTEKLKKEGDVSQEEADLVYILKRLQEAYQGSAKAAARDIFSGEFPGFPKLKSDVNNDAMEFNFIDSFLDRLLDAFGEWYGTVADLVASGRTGNFVTSIPVRSLFLNVKKEPGLVRLIDSAVNFLSEEDRETVITGKQLKKIRSQIVAPLTLDAISFENNTSLKFSRYGLVPRLNRKTNDILFLQRMTKKLKNEDITPEESDLIYIIMKFAQALKTPAVRYHNYSFAADSEIELKKQTKELQSALSSWFKGVFEAIISGRCGNFLYTLPIYGLEGLGSACVYIKKSLNLLPGQFIMAKFSDKPDFPDMAGIFFDSERNVLMSQRYGVVREAAKFDKHIVFADPQGASCAVEWEEDEWNIYNHICCWNEDRMVIVPSAIKSEFLSRRKGILPICRLRGKNDSYFIEYDKKDEKIVRSVFNIPDKELKSRFPVFSRERNLSEVLKESLCVIDAFDAIFGRKNFDEEDDSWIDVIR